MTADRRHGIAADRLIGAAMAAGIALRLWQYLGNPSLWIDELALARNILERPLSGLLGSPLDFAQVSPPGFLLLVKGAVSLFGNGEYALRLVPFLGGLIALPLFLALARRALPAPAVPVAMLLFAIAPPLFQHPAQLHQYSTDVAAAIALAVLALRWVETPDARRGLALGLAAAILVWFSQTTVLVWAGIVVALILGAAGSDRRARIRSLIPGGLIAGAGLLAGFLVANASLTPAVRTYMHSFWERGFIPRQPAPAIQWAFQWLPDPFQKEFGLGRALAVVYTLLLLLGWWRLWRRNRAVSLVIFTPVLVTLAAALAHRYPFAHRLVVFLLPSALLGIAAAIDWLGATAARWRPRVRAGVVAALMLPAIAAVLRRHPVIRVEDARPVWEHIAAARQPGEPVYIYFGGWLAAGYYAPRVGIPDRDLYYGRCHVNDPAGYRAELNTLAGKGRLWLFFTHTLQRDRVTIVGYLDSAATRLDSILVAKQPRGPVPGADAYRYDLTAMTRGPEEVRPPSSPACTSPAPSVPVDSALVGWGRRRRIAVNGEQ